MGPGFFLGVGAVFGALVQPYLWAEGLIVALGCLALLLTALTRRVSAISLLIGALFGLLSVSLTPMGPELSGWTACVGRVAEAPVGRSVRFQVSRCRALGRSWQQTTGWISLRFATVPPRRGASLLVAGEAHRVRLGGLPGESNRWANATRSGVRSELRVRTWRPFSQKPERANVLRSVEHLGVVEAIARGERSEVSEETRQLLRRTGTAHLLAISGYHVGLVAWLAYGLITLVSRVASVGIRSGVPDVYRVVFASGVAWAYTLAVGSPISAQRALLLLLFAGAGRLLGRRVNPLDLLGWVALLLVIIDPGVVSSAGFQLSFCAVIGIIRIGGWLNRWVPPDWPWGFLFLYRALATSLGAILGTGALSLWWFEQASWVGLFANVLAIPWVGFVVAPLSLAAVWGPAESAQLFGAIASSSVSLFLSGLRLFDVDPIVYALGLGGTSLCTAALLCPRPLLRALLFLPFFSMGGTPRTVFRVTFLDVGQGDAALVEFPDGRRWLVDGGPPSRRVLSWLRGEGISHLDRVIASHGHPDHVGGLPAVLRSVSVDELWISDVEGMDALLNVADARGVPVILAGARSLHPHPPFIGSLNDRSLVLTADWGPYRVLFTGDIELKAEQIIGLGRIDLLKVAHHGSRTSSSEAFLQRVAPRASVISAGRLNRFSHPHRETLDRLSPYGPVFRTDQLGTIVFEFDDDGMSVQNYLGGVGWTARRSLNGLSSK